MSILVFPAPDPLNGDLLTEELAAAGFTNPEVSLYRDREGEPDVVQVMADELTDHMPPAEMRTACRTRKELDFLLWCYAEEAYNADAPLREKIAPIVAAHRPPEK